MTTELNPFEYTIFSFLQTNEGRKFTASEIATGCNMNLRTAHKYSDTLFFRKLIKRESLKTRQVRPTLMYYI